MSFYKLYYCLSPTIETPVNGILLYRYPIFMQEFDYANFAMKILRATPENQ